MGNYRLQSQDSLGITRARLARQRENARMALLNQINSMQARAARRCWYPACVFGGRRERGLPIRWWCGQAAVCLLLGVEPWCFID